MNEQVKMLLLFQLLPVVFLFMLIGGLVISVTDKSYMMGDPGTPYLTEWERNPDKVIRQFWQGMEFVVFFFVAGLPFEVALLYFDKVDRRNAAIEAIRSRKNRR